MPMLSVGVNAPYSAAGYYANPTGVQLDSAGNVISVSNGSNKLGTATMTSGTAVV
jgi:hypothetical protein